MKKFTRILSLVLAVSLVACLFTVNVMAASKAHTVTISAKEATGLKAGDTVTIEVAIDNTEALVSCGYELTYDATAFTADTTKVSRVEACIDKPWLDGIKDPDGDWAYYLGNPTYNVGKAGLITFQWAGSEGVEAEYAKDNRVIGKFYLTVAEGASGSYQFALTGSTMDAGENSEADMICAPVTVTVGAAGPEIGGVVAGAKDGVTGESGTKYDNAYASTVSFTGLEAYDGVGMLFVPKKVVDAESSLKIEKGEALVEDAYFAGTTLGTGNVTLKAAIVKIPAELAGKEFVMVTRPYYVSGGVPVYGAASEATVEYTISD